MLDLVTLLKLIATNEGFHRFGSWISGQPDQFLGLLGTTRIENLAEPNSSKVVWLLQE